MKKIFSILLVLILALIIHGTSTAQLNVQAVVSSDYSFYDQWYRTISESVPLVNKSEKVYHDQALFVYVFFSGYGIDSLDMADVNYNLKIFKPDNSLLEEHLKILGYKGKIVNPNNLILSIANLRFNFELTEPTGNYRVEVELIDKILNEKITANSQVSLSEISLSSTINSDSLLGKWLETYYQTPTPELAVDAFIYFTKSDLRTKVEESVFAFFRELFSHNLYLVLHLISKYDFQDETTRNDILMLIAFLNVDVSEFINKLPQNKLHAYQQLKKNSNLFDYSDLEHPTQIDMIWSEFFASGRYGTIRRLVDALSFSQYNGAIDLYNNSGKDESLEKNALLEASYKSAVWSLGANAATHKLVKDYLMYILKNEQLDDNTRKELENITIN
jgi:hypothetical protein